MVAQQRSLPFLALLALAVVFAFYTMRLEVDPGLLWSSVALRRDSCRRRRAPYPSPFDHTYVISLAARSDRRAHMRRLEAVTGLSMTLLDAVDKNSARVQTVARNVTGTHAENGLVELGAIACRFSHVEALLAAEHADDQVTLILEDDVDLEVEFTYLTSRVLAALPPTWDVVFFGHSYSEEASRGLATPTQHPHVYRANIPQGAYAYAVSAHGRALLLSLLDPTHHPAPLDAAPHLPHTSDEVPIDELYRDLARDRLADVYSVLPRYAVQAPAGILGSDISHGGFDVTQIDNYGVAGRLMDSAMEQAAKQGVEA